jgi:uncharacterized protein
MDFITLAKLAHSLLLLQGIFQSGPGAYWLEFVKSGGDPQAYGKWFYALADRGQSWQTYLLERLLIDDNPFSRAVQRGERDPGLEAAVIHDLRQLQQIYHCSADHLAALCHSVSWSGGKQQPPAAWHEARNWATLLPELVAHYRRQGTGIFGEYDVLRWQDGRLQGIKIPDATPIEDLIGYEWQQEALVKNTAALVAGYPALNVLLYGARGTGKSSLIKSLVPEFADRGLRLIEVSKQGLMDLPQILETLRARPQKFILFVDDLSFEADEAAFKALKVVLEGGAIGRPPNLVVYATSNRRHLIREFFADRPRPQDSDEIHNWDTVQEKLSFSDRFGLTLTFEPTDQDTYLAIIRHLAAGIDISATDLEFRALQWATQQNGRSGRTARQFVDFLRADTLLPFSE